LETEYIVAIGDLHGFARKFEVLWEKLTKQFGVTGPTAEFVFLGDYVDGGYQTAELVDMLRHIEADYPAIFLRGNHEQMLLDANASSYNDWKYQHWYSQGGAATNLSYQTANKYAFHEDMEWFSKLPYVYETENHIFVHAGLRPFTDAIHETSDMEMMWIRQDFLDTDFDFWGKRVVVGHTYHPKPLIKPNLICIDTMHHSAGIPTAAILKRHDKDYVEILQ
jgi:serine/threonine protein phosphatase 1